MSFINDDFMLRTETAKKLYHDYAEDMPIIDYHCHLVPKMIAENKTITNGDKSELTVLPKSLSQVTVTITQSLRNLQRLFLIL